MGRANAMKIAEHGTMTKVVNRSPKDSRSRSSPISPRPAALKKRILESKRKRGELKKRRSKIDI